MVRVCSLAVLAGLRLSSDEQWRTCILHAVEIACSILFSKSSRFIAVNSPGVT